MTESDPTSRPDHQTQDRDRPDHPTASAWTPVTPEAGYSSGYAAGAYEQPGWSAPQAPFDATSAPKTAAPTPFQSQPPYYASTPYDSRTSHDTQTAYGTQTPYGATPTGFGYGAPQPHGQQPYGAAPTATYDAPAGSPTGTAAGTPAGPRRMRTTLIGTAVLAALIGGGVGAGTVAATGHDSSSGSGITVSDQTAKNSATQSGTVTAAAQAITPSVVTIDVTGGQESGIGSGIVIRSDGYILTNNHVVSVAGSGGSIAVQTSDGRTAKGTVVGTDASDDLAVIKVSGLSNLKAATFAQSSKVQVGQTVVAVGAPLGLSETVTSGIVSATARPVRSGDNDTAVFAAIQTDAAINPGNSGGALVDLNGNVVGVNAAIATTNSGGVTVPGQSTQSGSIGIGFAIPSDEASRIASELISTGKATHAVMGVTVRSSTNSTSIAGATVSAVTANGAAASAGLKSGDVVTEVDGTRIDDGDSLIAVVRSHSPGDSVQVTYTRDGQTRTATVKLTSATS